MAPLVFSFNLFDTTRYVNVTAAFFSFCFLSSFVYVFNDLKDLESDKLHPRKQNRPLPSGRIGKTPAIIAGIGSLLISVILAAIVNSTSFFVALGCYLCINIAYIIILKQISLVDCFCIATGFVIRVLAGCYAINVIPSDWIVVVTFFLALFLAFSKRKSEIVLLDKNSAQHRTALSGYSVKTLDVFIYICASICITAYLMYTLTSTSIPAHLHDSLKYSAFFVVFGLFRYIQINEAERNTDGDPTVLFYKDRLLQITILLWVIYSIYVIYG